MDQDLFTKEMSTYQENILALANQAYELVMVDVNSGVNSEITKTILQSADIVIINLNQSNYILD